MRRLRPRMTDRAISSSETTDRMSFRVSSSSLLLLQLFQEFSSLSVAGVFLTDLTWWWWFNVKRVV